MAGHDHHDVEQLLAGCRERPSAELRSRVAGAVVQERRASRRLRGSRAAFTSAVLVGMAGSLASFGSLGYAASGAAGAAHAVREAVSVSAVKVRVVHQSAAQTQYKPEKVAICHRRGASYISVEVAPGTVKAHLKHGDKLPVNGTCPVVKSAKKVKTSPKVSGVGGSTTGGLPFTGQGLAGTALAALSLLAVGLLLRRSARRRA